MAEDKNRKRIIVNFKNNDLELKLYNHVKSLELENHSAYIKKLIAKDMRDQGLL